ncbi:MAG: N-acetylglucosamine-6-phosphate deacetylase [Rhodobacteraceae bacterium]|nr:N-acetylglucosamine-6-phosphate deacetylase [Paracoccaceae bacterium]
MTRTVYSGAAVFDGTRMHHDAVLVVEGSEIAGILPEAAAPEGPRVALSGGVLAPGFLDLQVNGGGGEMLHGGSGVEGIARICAAHARLGVTGLLPTLITDTAEATQAVIEAGVAAAEAGVPGFLGLHLEGPHLDPKRHGAHDTALIRPMEAADLEMLRDAAARLPVLKVTVAPESVSLAQVSALARAGAVVSLGHSDGPAAEALRYFAAGASNVTHLFNAMSPLTHREPGLAGAALDQDVSCGLIADGVHVLPAVLRIALTAKRGRDRVFLVTDAMAVAGTDAAEFELGGRRILRRDGRLTLADGTLAGADVDMTRSIRVLVEDAGLDLAEALRMATAVPASVIGEAGRLGCLARGGPADFVHLDAGLRLAGVWRAGGPVALD